MSSVQANPPAKAESASKVQSHRADTPEANALHTPPSDEPGWAQAAGNLAIQQLFRAGAIQAKLTISQANDPDEEEADRIADRVMRMEEPYPIGTGRSGIHRKCAACESSGTPCPSCEEEEKIQRKKAPGSTAQPGAAVQSKISALRGGGKPLSPSMRAYFEPRFGRDFRAVRIHQDEASQATAQAIHARAYTFGPNIVFGQSPDTAGDRRLLAHELTHVVQQGYAPETSAEAPVITANGSDTRIQRDDGEDTATAPPAAPAASGPAAADYPDDRLLPMLRQGVITPLYAVQLMGGLRSLEVHQPQSYAFLRQRLESEYGEEAVRGVYDNEQRILDLAAKSSDITASLSELQSHYFETDQEAAWEYINAIYGSYEWSYVKIFEHYVQHGEGALAILELFMNGDAESITSALEDAADSAQADEIELEANRAEWTEIGEGAIGEEVATREIFMWWDASISLESLLEPTYGTETEAEALAWARISGQACAVKRVGDRYYAYVVSDQFTYDDVFMTEEFEEHRSEVVPAAGASSGVRLVTVEGYVLTRNGERYFGGAQSDRPEYFAEGTAGLLRNTANLTSAQALALFKNATLDMLLINLTQAETNLRGQMHRVFPVMGMGRRTDVDRDFGALVKSDAADLRGAMTTATNLINRVEDEDFSEENELELMEALETIGRINSQNPSAALMVTSNRDPESTAPVEEGEIENRAEEMSPAEAAWEVGTELSQRLQNIELIRRHFHGNPDETLSLTPLHENILPRFTLLQQFDIRLSIAGHQLSDLAAAIGIPVLELLLIITGAVAGGPLGAGLAAGATTLGAFQTKEQLEEAERLRAGAALDLPGGFQLNTPAEAASATRWAYISLALTVLDVGELASGNRIMRLLGRGVGRAAGGIGRAVTEGAQWARHTLGLPADVVVNLTISGINRLRSLTADMLERFAQLSDALKRVLLGCASPCRVDLATVRAYLLDPARVRTASTAPLTTIDEVVASLPAGIHREAIRDQLTRHPALLTFIQEAGISADDLSGLSAFLTRGDTGASMASRTFSRYLTSLIPAKVGPDIAEFNRIAAAASASEREVASALKGPMFENYARLYISDFRFAGFTRRSYTRSVIPGLEASQRASDGFISRSGELWDFKHTAGRVDAAQARDYERILAYEASRTPPGVTSINYLFPDRAAAEANRHLLDYDGFAVWYLGPSGRRQRLRP